VVSTGAEKTVVVAIRRRVKHPLYGKIINQTRKLMAHDEKGEAAVGDKVRIEETRPLSKLKCWRLAEVLTHLVEEGKLVREEGRWRTRVTSASGLGIPEGVREVVGRRLSRLSEPCNRMLTLAAMVLSDRMIKRIREDEQLVYSIRAFHSPGSGIPGTGMMQAAAPTDPSATTSRRSRAPR